MALATKQQPGRLQLETLLGEAIKALAALDAERAEELAALVESVEFAAGFPSLRSPVEWPQSAAEWRRALASHCVLGHLIDATGRQLSIQRRIAVPAERFHEYGPEANAHRMNRWIVALSQPRVGESRRES